VVTSWDVAREAGVSQATVSRVLNGDSKVAAPTRARVLEAVQRLGYRPNSAARSLVTRRTQLVGVVVADISNPFYPQLLGTIDSELVGRGFRTVFSNSEGRPHDLQTQTLLEQRVDGVVFTAVELDSDEPRTLVAQGLPVVLVNRYLDGLDCDVVVGDNEGGGRRAAEHLLELGHRRIAVLLGDPLASTSRDRFLGFRARLAEDGVELDEALVRIADFSCETASVQAAFLFDADPRPTAIFCANDLMAFGVLNAARRAGVAVPEELSVVGFNDIAYAAWESFELTTIRLPLTEMARTAVELLVKRIESPQRAFERIVFPSLLVTRATTGGAAAERKRGPRVRASRHAGRTVA